MPASISASLIQQGCFSQRQQRSTAKAGGRARGTGRNATEIHLKSEDGDSSAQPAARYKAGRLQFFLKGCEVEKPNLSGVGRVFTLSTFGEALEALKQGLRVQRVGWNGAGQYLELQIPDEGSKMTAAYIFIRTVQGALVPWVASQSDLLARDWRTV
jgi:hypothetical protein